MFQGRYADVALDDQTSARRREYDALGEVVRRLEHVAGRSRDRDAVEAALELHDSVWMVFMSDLADDNNALPDDLRARLISIGLWATRRSLIVRLSGGELQSLIEINSIVRDGLR